MMKYKCIKDLVYYNENDDKMKFENGKVYDVEDVGRYCKVFLNESLYYHADMSKAWFKEYFECLKE